LPEIVAVFLKQIVTKCFSPFPASIPKHIHRNRKINKLTVAINQITPGTRNPLRNKLLQINTKAQHTKTFYPDKLHKSQAIRERVLPEYAFKCGAQYPDEKSSH